LGAQGTVVLDFGAFPGKSDASVVVTGQAAIVAGSLVEAWIRPVATADHDADDHIFAPLKVVAGNIVPGTGFTVYGYIDSALSEPLLPGGEGRAASSTVGAQSNDGAPRIGGKGMRLWGLYNINWVWN
jgi:hypothetical protein